MREFWTDILKNQAINLAGDCDSDYQFFDSSNDEVENVE